MPKMNHDQIEAMRNAINAMDEALYLAIQEAKSLQAQANVAKREVKRIKAARNLVQRTFVKSRSNYYGSL